MRHTKPVFDAEDVALAKDALDSERQNLIDALLNIPFFVDMYKRDAADAARHGVSVPFTDTMKEAMNEAMKSIADLFENADEWSSR